MSLTPQAVFATASANVSVQCLSIDRQFFLSSGAQARLRD